MTRVCMVAYTYYPADSRVRREAESLVQRGDEVDIVCPQVPGAGPNTKLEGVGVHSVTKFAHENIAGPADYIRVYTAFCVRAGIRVLQLHRRQPYDLIQVHTMPDFLVFTALAPKLLGARVILDVHDLMPELYAAKFGLPETHPIVRLIAAVERASIRFADRAMAVHRPHLAALVRRGNPADKFLILMNLSDPAIFRPRRTIPAPTPFKLIYHGTVSRRHGLDVAVRAVAAAREHVPTLELHVIGDGDYFAELRDLVDELGVSDSVRLQQQFFPVDQLLPIISEASAGIVPIVSDPFTRYMLPVKLLEFLSIGVPVIASRTGTIESYFDDSTIAFCSAGDPEDFAARIIELYRDPARRKALSQAGLTWSAANNWETEKRKYHDLIDSLVAPRKCRERGAEVQPGPRVDSLRRS